MRTQIAGMILLGSLTGCQALDAPFVVTQLEQEKKPEAAPSIASVPAATVSVKQKYLYALADDNVVYIRPINSDTGDIESPVVGGWFVRPAVTQDFKHFTISPDGKYFYGLDAFNSKIYQYAIGEIGAWSEYQYSTGLLTPLTPAYRSISISRSALAFGNDNRLYSKYVNQADQFNVNNGNLTYVQLFSVAGWSTAQAISQPNFSNITSVSSGDHTYLVNTNTGRVEHWMNGSLRDATDIGTPGFPKVPVHMIIN